MIWELESGSAFTAGYTPMNFISNYNVSIAVKNEWGTCHPCRNPLCHPKKSATMPTYLRNLHLGRHEINGLNGINSVALMQGYIIVPRMFP
ncbi:hypothetical protein HZ326_16189 [Fusarium oxysporum f. sp. albedinis]|nr:hypothetical protein HZ326_16189 [Fusarium oxysporum f. sp. albedinis]